MKNINFMINLIVSKRVKLTVTPEHRLLLSVLKRAIVDATTNDKVEPHHKESAIEWIWCDKTQKGNPFNFLNLCESLDIEPQDIRELISSGEIMKMMKTCTTTHEMSMLEESLGGSYCPEDVPIKVAI